MAQSVLRLTYVTGTSFGKIHPEELAISIIWSVSFKSGNRRSPLHEMPLVEQERSACFNFKKHDNARQRAKKSTWEEHRQRYSPIPRFIYIARSVVLSFCCPLCGPLLKLHGNEVIVGAWIWRVFPPSDHPFPCTLSLHAHDFLWFPRLSPTGFPKPYYQILV